MARAADVQPDIPSAEGQELAAHGQASLRGPTICACCGKHPAREGSEFCAGCARSFDAENWYQREYLDAVRDAFLYEHGEPPSPMVRRDFPVPEIRSYARALRAHQRKRGV